jgi:hypothetical protein
MAVAVPLAIAQLDLIVIVTTFETSGECREMDAVGLTSVAVSLFDLADHARIHQAPPDQTRIPVEQLPGAMEFSAMLSKQKTPRVLPRRCWASLLDYLSV